MSYWLYKLTDEELAPIKQEVYAIRDNFDAYKKYDGRKRLAGNIDHEYSLHKCNSSVESIVLRELSNWNTESDIISSVDRHFGVQFQLKLAILWANFQKKYEFNPVHNHSGAFSFVIWLDIPYNIQAERNYRPYTNEQVAGCFQFVIPSNSGIETIDIPVDKTYNGTMAIFPSSMMHTVYPFYTSDDYRITVSGNISCYPLEI